MPPAPAAKQLASTSDAASTSAPSLIAFSVALIASAMAATAIIGLVLRSRSSRGRRPLWNKNNNANLAGPTKAATKSTTAASGAGLSPTAAASAIEELRDRCRQYYTYTHTLTLRAALRQPRPRWNLPAILELAEVSAVSDVAKRDPDCGKSVVQQLRKRNRGDDRCHGRSRLSSSRRHLNRLRMRPAKLVGVRKAGGSGRRQRRRQWPPPQLLARIEEMLRANQSGLRCDATAQPGTPQHQQKQQHQLLQQPSPTAAAETSTVVAAPTVQEAREAGSRRSKARQRPQQRQFVLRLTATTSINSAATPTMLSHESTSTKSSGAALQLSTTESDSGSDSRS